MASADTRVSVCMATYNGERFIEPQLRSILPQLGPKDEVIVSDDGSTDRTLEKIGGFHDERIRVFQAGRRGVSLNFDNALARASGRYIFLADQDDVWLEGKLSESCEALERHGLVVTDCKVVDTEGNELHPSYFALVGARPGLLRNFLRTGYLGCCMAFRRELLDLALPIPRSVAHDFWIAMLAELTGRPYFLARALLLYRRHGSTASYFVGQSGRTFATRIASRTALAVQLAIRMATAKRHRGS